MTSTHAASRVAGATLLLAGLFAAVPAEASNPSYVPNASLSKGSAGWSASSSARLTGSAKARTLTVAPRSSSGETSISMTSSGAGRAVTHARTQVHVTADLRVSEVGRDVTIQVREVDRRGRTVQNVSTSRRNLSPGYHWYAADLTTRRASSRIRVTLRTTVTGGHTLTTRRVIASVGTSPVASRLGRGMLRIPTAASAWVAANPGDTKRAPLISRRIASEPAALWVLKDTWRTNLTEDIAKATKEDRALTLVLYNIPHLNDGVSGMSGAADLADYQAWVDEVAAVVGSARVTVVIEPDALWLIDQTGRDPSSPEFKRLYAERMASLRYAAATMSALPNTRAYLEAGTTTGGVLAPRMADLLADAGASPRVGFAVNVSSYAPTADIMTYARAVRATLRSRYGIADPRFVVDTGRNGNPSWPQDRDRPWCNPDGRWLGDPPRVVDATDGLDMNLWVKGPGESDGNCGTGYFTYGGQFMPEVAYRMAGGAG